MGAGVSANSDLPTWSQLISKFAEEIGIEKKNGQKYYQFTSDDFLKIPQFMYDLNPLKYKKIIKESFDAQAESNPLNDIILDLLPNHIITTNYDKLFEKSSNINLSQYKVVSNDSNLLTQINQHYIIKMHGDINEMDKIVLKEDDYLNYSSERILTETFIKSLLIDHTFLFVGYSLNDYNLKIIMSWVEYLSKKEKVDGIRHKNFIFLTNPIQHYQKNYWENKNFTILESEEIPDNLLDKYSNNFLVSKAGKKLYTFLNIIKDSNSDMYIETIPNVLKERYTIFDPLIYIYSHDLIKTSNIKNYIIKSNLLIIHGKENGKELYELFQDEDIIKYWEKSGIKKICFVEINKTITITDSRELQKENDILTDIIHFRFREAGKKIINHDKENRKFYYKGLVIPSSEKVISFFKQQFSLFNTKWDNILNKYNSFLLEKMKDPFQVRENESIQYTRILTDLEKISYKYLYTLILEGKDYQKVEYLSTLLKKVENTYKKPPTLTTDPYGDLINIKTYTYEHFYFIKYNGLFLDKFSETTSFVEYYLKALLISQTVIQNSRLSIGYNIVSSLKNYAWNYLDIYLFITYGNYKSLLEYINDNNIKEIIYSEEIDISELFVNFSDSLTYILEYDNYDLVENLKKFSLLLSLSNLSLSQKKQLLPPILSLLSNQKAINKLTMENEIKYLFKLINLTLHDKMKINMLDFKLILHNLFPEAYQSQYVLQLLWKLKKSNVSYNQNDFDDLFNEVFNQKQTTSEKLLVINNLYPLLSIDTIITHTDFLDENPHLLDFELQIYLDQNNMVSNTIKEKLKGSYITSIKSAIEKQETGVITFPNPIELSISKSLILFLYDYFYDITFLKEFVSHSDLLNFIFTPKTFDYSKIDLTNYMWVNLIKREEYLRNILKYGKKQVTDVIKEKIKLKSSSEEEKMLFYRFLVDIDELWAWV